MAFNFEDCDISGNQTGVRAPASADVSFKRTDIKQNAVGIDVYIDQNLLEKLSLPKDTPLEYLEEVKALLIEHQNDSLENKAEKLGQTKLYEWLGNSSSIITVGTFFFQLSMNLIKIFTPAP